MKPMLNEAKYTLITRPWRSVGTVRSRNERSAAKNRAEPTPPAARRITREGKFGARAAPTDETPTQTAPRVAIERSPYRSMKRPTNGSATSRVNENAEISRPTESYPTPKLRA